MVFPFLVILAGFLTGVFSGLYGIGGALILTPFLRIFLEQPDRIALGTTLPVIIPTALFGLLGRRGKGLFKADVFFSSSAGMLVGSVLGSFLTGHVLIKYLMLATALLIFLTGIKMAFQLNASFKIIPRQLKLRPVVVNFLLGFVAGLLSGLLGIGGGLVLVPGYIYLRNLSPFEATTTSLGVILIAALPGSFIHTLLGHVDWKLAFLLGLTTPMGSYLGSRLGLKLTGKEIEKGFGWLLILTAMFFVLYEMK
jgi:uncharacterized membrane protein YfcA